MRRVIGLFATAILALGGAQSAVPEPSGPVVPPGLKSYLSLSEVQAERLYEVNDEYSRLMEGKKAKLGELSRAASQGQVDAYGEMEVIGRDAREAGRKVVQKTRAILTPEQRSRLSAAQNAGKPKDVLEQAVAEHLLLSSKPTTGEPGFGGSTPVSSADKAGKSNDSKSLPPPQKQTSGGRGQ